jgi:hypothetical protein
VTFPLPWVSFAAQPAPFAKNQLRLSGRKSIM